MAYLAACTDKGTRKQVNEDACCVEVAQTPLGEVALALVCDGVGGLSRGNVASSTVVDRFSHWFEDELPLLLAGMTEAGTLDLTTVKAVWSALLQSLNDLIYSYGVQAGVRLGTTFTGLIVGDGRYLVGHVGDCRAYRMSAGSFAQLTEDQTQVARRLAAGEITEEEARRAPKNVILQAVGSQQVLAPVFYEGTCTVDDLFVICCDGAFKRAGNEGVQKLFQPLDYRDEAALQKACATLLQFDMDCGEKDNLTVVCLSADLAAAGEDASEPRASLAAEAEADVPTPVVVADEDDLPTMVEGDEDDLPTMVEAEPDEDDLPTMVEADEDDLPTMVEEASDSDEDDLPTMVESDEDDLPTIVEPESDEDDLPTMVESEEDDLPTMVEEASDSDEDDLPTMVESGLEEDDLPTMVEGDEDDLPTMVEAEPDEDDLPTMVEGGDA